MLYKKSIFYVLEDQIEIIEAIGCIILDGNKRNGCSLVYISCSLVFAKKFQKCPSKNLWWNLFLERTELFQSRFLGNVEIFLEQLCETTSVPKSSFCLFVRSYGLNAF